MAPDRGPQAHQRAGLTARHGLLVVSAVEGVQAQTRVLLRALRRLRIPTLNPRNRKQYLLSVTRRVARASRPGTMPREEPP